MVKCAGMTWTLENGSSVKGSRVNSTQVKSSSGSLKARKVGFSFL